MTGSHELCMLIDGVVKRYPTAVVELKTPYYTGTAKVLCMDSPVQDIIIGNIPGARGAEVTCNHDDSTESLGDLEPVNEEVTIICDKSNSITRDHRDQINTPEEQTINSDDQLIDHSDTKEQCAAVQTRAMVAIEGKPPKPLKVKSMPGLDIGPDELKAKQKADPTLRKYCELGDKSVDGVKQQFFTKKGILYRRYCGKQNTDNLIQLVVPNELREKVVSLAHDTLLAGHRGAGKTLSRVQQEFYWPGIHEYVTRYVASCDLCQRNISKGTVAKAPMGKLNIGNSVFYCCQQSVTSLL